MVMLVAIGLRFERPSDRDAVLGKTCTTSKCDKFIYSHQKRYAPSQAHLRLRFKNDLVLVDFAREMSNSRHRVKARWDRESRYLRIAIAGYRLRSWIDDKST